MLGQKQHYHKLFSWLKLLNLQELQCRSWQTRSHGFLFQLLWWLHFLHGLAGSYPGNFTSTPNNGFLRLWIALSLLCNLEFLF
uniref:Uncharacterized protein n=1 Tax=Arundo donax TaxID=35708 RepID=A0A0A9DRB2_ARUDO